MVEKFFIGAGAGAGKKKTGTGQKLTGSATLPTVENWWGDKVPPCLFSEVQGECM